MPAGTMLVARTRELYEAVDTLAQVGSALVQPGMGRAHASHDA
jgi:hypothetical protein